MALTTYNIHVSNLNTDQTEILKIDADSPEEAQDLVPSNYHVIMIDGGGSPEEPSTTANLPGYVMTVPVISTVHIKPATFDRLAHWFNQSEFEHICMAKMIDGRGFFLYVDEDVSEDGEFLPCDSVPDLEVVLRWAADRDYRWIRLDSDGEEIQDLPRYLGLWP